MALYAAVLPSASSKSRESLKGWLSTIKAGQIPTSDPSSADLLRNAKPRCVGS